MLELVLRPSVAADVVLYDGGGLRFDCRLYAQGGPDVVLRPWDYEDIIAVGGFPTQYSGFRGQRTSGTVDLCLVATADAPAGMGASPRIQKGGVTYAVYLVDTTDPQASPFRIRTSAGTKAIRLKT